LEACHTQQRKILECKVSKKELNNPQKPGSIDDVAVSESSLLVPLAKSKKLTAIRGRLQTLQTLEKSPVQIDETHSLGLNKEVNGLLKEARELINAKIDKIMASYPAGKKNKMFALRYGSPETIKQMKIKAIFARLAIVKAKKFALIESLNYFGNDTKPDPDSNPGQNI
jgi:hypothetical protein